MIIITSISSNQNISLHKLYLKLQIIILIISLMLSLRLLINNNNGQLSKNSRISFTKNNLNSK